MSATSSVPLLHDCRTLELPDAVLYTHMLDNGFQACVLECDKVYHCWLTKPMLDGETVRQQMTSVPGIPEVSDFSALYTVNFWLVQVAALDKFGRAPEKENVYDGPEKWWDR